MVFEDEFLYDCFYEKTMELGRPPTCEELADDKSIPHYITFRRRLGKKNEICQALGIENVSSHTHRFFCVDCPHEPESCGEDINECLDEAGDYLEGVV
ncbi:hypothetical protein [Halarsenatibacter silvermanii]|uniref:Uncharacterized protein n=1 Tax=Halarsenatibacter silvermanii TaxID=321763 RepID=A0A1G9S8R9_9FIRM|nr:hypothetical protein [Halarsenatibacter silvermanii]SDM31854.1 hypothetical protein SAMN04488692_1271 [Halarsenatibacter silvermanii]